MIAAPRLTPTIGEMMREEVILTIIIRVIFIIGMIFTFGFIVAGIFFFMKLMEKTF